ncbi:MAG: hypothetical protein AAFQ67_02495 [Pseudomonadota bacterium]
MKSIIAVLIVTAIALVAIAQTNDDQIEALADSPQSLFLGDLKLGVQTDDAFLVRENGAQLIVNLANPTEGLDREEIFDLEALPTFVGSGIAPKDGATVHYFQVKAEDAARTEDLRREVERLRREAPEGTSELTFSASTPGCRNPEIEDAPDTLALNLYIQTTAGEGFIQFAPEQTFSFKDGGFSEAFWSPCDAD